MAGVSQTMDLAGLAAELSRLAGVRLDTAPLFAEIRQILVSDHKEYFEQGRGPDGQAWKPLAHPRPGSKGSDKPLRDYGLLMASLTSQGAEGHHEQQTAGSLEWGTNLEKGPLLNYGGVVKPTSAKMLAIPLTREAVRAGRARDFPEQLWIMRHGNQALLMGPKKGRTKPVAHYVLALSVTIPARPFIGLSDSTQEKIARAVTDGVAAQAADRLAG